MVDRPTRAVLFDLDGTLIDSVPDLARAVNAALVAVGRPPASEVAVAGWVGNGVRMLLARALSGRQAGDVDPAVLARAWPAFERSYTANLAAHTRVYPQVRETLATLAGRGLALGCVTNKPARFTVPLLKQLRLHRHFGAVVSGDDLAVRKPDPAPLLAALRRLQVVPARAAMVGDSIIDLQAARAAGCAAIAVSWGYHQGRDLQSLGADAVITRMAALEAALRDLGRLPGEGAAS